MNDSTRAPTSGPLFATVAFTNESDQPVHTFRVPITESTTVRRLAKDALQRFYHSVRSFNKDAQACDFFVREICVGEFKAEIFPQDLVMQVVSIKEEKIFMKVGNKAFALPETQPQQAAAAHDAHATSTSPLAAAHSASPPLESTSALLGNTLLESERSMDLTLVAPPTTRMGESKEDPRPLPPGPRISAPHFVRSNSPARVENASSAATSIPKAPRQQPQNQVNRQVTTDTPLDKASTRVPKTKQPKTSPKKHHRDGEQTTPEAVRVIDTEKLTARQLSRLVEQKNKDGVLAWGESAHKLFPTNYMSNPDDVKKLLANRPSVMTVANQALSNSSDDDNDERSGIVFRSLFEDTCPPHASTRADVIDVDVNSQTPDAARPKGWGSDASKYFDPKTWFDDPRKAKLTAEELNEPLKARRRVELPSVRHLL